MKSNSTPLDEEVAAPARAQKFMRRPEVEKMTGLPTSTLYEMVRAGEFPAPIHLQKRIVVWLERDVAAWQAAQIAANRA